MKYLLLLCVLFVFFSVVLAGTGCNVVSCSNYCRSVGNFGGFCNGPDLNNCHCYNVPDRK